MQLVARKPKAHNLRQWRWGMPKWYNGFSPEERVRGWQVSHWLQEIGAIPRPSSCCICDSKQCTSYHNENYYTPWNAYSVCKRCHYALHNRHRCPELLQRLLTEHGAGRGGWLNDLSTGGAYDLAEEIRAREGKQVAYIENYLPNSLSTIFPKHQLLPLENLTDTATAENSND